MSTRNVWRFFLPSAVLLFLAFPVAHAWWDEKCAEDGQCSTMFKSYETLLKGNGCRSFYFTGKCSRICTYSLKSLIGRHTWTKCAERCEWSKAVTNGISSWLDMCLANPAPELFESDDSDSSDNFSTGHRAEPNNHNYASLESKSTGRALVRVVASGAVPFVVLIVAFCVVAMTCMPTQKEYLYNRMWRGVDFIGRRWARPFQRRTGLARGPLDSGPDREELRSLQRGARRHLKAMRATLD